MLLHRLKMNNPELLTVFGGMSLEEGKFMIDMFPFIDVCVYGEGEQTFFEFCQNYSDRSNFDKIQEQMRQDSTERFKKLGII